MDKQRCIHSKFQIEKLNGKGEKKTYLGNSKITEAKIDVLRETDFDQ
jgi:hypothetical protein